MKKSFILTETTTGTSEKVASLKPKRLITYEIALLQVPYKKHTVQLASFVIFLKHCTSFFTTVSF